MNKVILIGKSIGCSLCEGWKRKLAHMNIPFTFIDTTTVDGLAEMAFSNIGRIPALIINGLRFEEISPAHLTSEEILTLVNENSTEKESLDILMKHQPGKGLMK